MSRFIALAAPVAAAVVVAGNAGATAPSNIRFPLNITAPSPEYTAACGFVVLLSANGTVEVTVHTNHDGSVREQDVFPGLTVTGSAPSTGRSFRHAFGPGCLYEEWVMTKLLGHPSHVAAIALGEVASAASAAPRAAANATNVGAGRPHDETRMGADVHRVTVRPRRTIIAGRG